MNQELNRKIMTFGILLLFLLILPLTVVAQPQAGDDRGVLGCEEPATNTDGSSLSDLKEIVCSYRIPSRGSWTVCFAVPATAPEGGGIMENGGATDCIILERDIKEMVDFGCRACDFDGLCSIYSNIVKKMIDRYYLEAKCSEKGSIE